MKSIQKSQDIDRCADRSQDRRANPESAASPCEQRRPEAPPLVRPSKCCRIGDGPRGRPLLGLALDLGDGRSTVAAKCREPAARGKAPRAASNGRFGSSKRSSVQASARSRARRPQCRRERSQRWSLPTGHRQAPGPGHHCAGKARRGTARPNEIDTSHSSTQCPCRGSRAAPDPKFRPLRPTVKWSACRATSSASANAAPYDDH